MKDVNYNSALLQISSLPFLFLGSPNLSDKFEINRSSVTIPINVNYASDSNGYNVFQSLPNCNIELETSEKDILIEFISKISTESKDLDGEIVDMVNRKFEKLLLKI